MEDRGLEKYLHVARVPHDGLLGPWEFWTGLLGWGLNPATSARIQGGVSNLVTAFGTGDGYLLITQEQLGRRIYALWSPTPTGPWSNPQTIYTTPEGPGLFTYNAVAHPELSGDGRLLLSYSVSGADGQAPAAPPRFVRVPVACLKGR